jgi:predicted nucleic acid-binding protein
VSHLLDTNVLVYSVDHRVALKRDRAREVMARLVELGTGVITSQVLAEFAHVSLRKLGWDPGKVYRQIERFELVYSVLSITQALVLEAVRGVRDHRFGYYDAQIWASAKLHQVKSVLSEDFANGAVIEGVAFTNPFDDDFELTDLR